MFKTLNDWIKHGPKRLLSGMFLTHFALLHLKNKKHNFWYTFCSVLTYSATYWTKHTSDEESKNCCFCICDIIHISLSLFVQNIFTNAIIIVYFFHGTRNGYWMTCFVSEFSVVKFSSCFNLYFFLCRTSDESPPLLAITATPTRWRSPSAAQPSALLIPPPTTPPRSFSPARKEQSW